MAVTVKLPDLEKGHTHLNSSQCCNTDHEGYHIYVCIRYSMRNIYQCVYSAHLPNDSIFISQMTVLGSIQFTDSSIATYVRMQVGTSCRDPLTLCKGPATHTLVVGGRGVYQQ